MKIKNISKYYLVLLKNPLKSIKSYNFDTTETFNFDRKKLYIINIT